MNKSIWVFLGLALVMGVMIFTRGDLRNPVSTTSRDILEGSWGAKAAEGAEYPWFVTYTFDGKGTYSMRTDSTYKEDGTYTIAERRENNVIRVHKKYGTEEQAKEYDMEVIVDAEGKTITIEGMVLTKN